MNILKLLKGSVRLKSLESDIMAYYNAMKLYHQKMEQNHKLILIYISCIKLWIQPLVNMLQI